jgi:RimJ/RimL family protein N-acetyltransferase
MFAVTERLLLRPGWIEDAPALAHAIADRAVVSKLETAPWPYQLRHAEEFLGGARDPRHPDFLIFARTLGAPRLVGGMGLRRNGGGDTELGYWIARPYWGLGFATEAGRAVVRLALESLKHPKLVSGHFIDNPASGHVLSKLGFRPTGCTVSRRCLARDTLVPCVTYELQDEAVANHMESAMAA